MTPNLQSYLGPADPNLQQVSSVLSRRTKLNQHNPDPPRGLRVGNGGLTWEAPQDPSDITHYNIYANDENHLVRQVAASQLQINDKINATQFLVTSYNSFSKRESSPAVLAVNGGIGGAGLFSGTGATFTPDFNNGLTQIWTLTADLTINAAINGHPGDEIVIVLVQDATGGWQATWDATYLFPGTFGLDPTPSTATVFVFRVNGSGHLFLKAPATTGTPWP